VILGSIVGISELVGKYVVDSDGTSVGAVLDSSTNILPLISLFLSQIASASLPLLLRELSTWSLVVVSIDRIHSSSSMSGEKRSISLSQSAVKTKLTVIILIFLETSNRYLSGTNQVVDKKLSLKMKLSVTQFMQFILYIQFMQLIQFIQSIIIIFPVN
jgi:hypothetical protein